MQKMFLTFATAIAAACVNALPAHAVDATVVWNEFTKNEGAFVQKYKGTAMMISGQVWDMNSESLPMVVLRGANDGNNYGTRVYCMLSDKNQALKVSKGDVITVAGTFSNAGGIGIYFKPCSVQ